MRKSARDLKPGDIVKFGNKWHTIRTSTYSENHLCSGQDGTKAAIEITLLNNPQTYLAYPSRRMKVR